MRTGRSRKCVCALAVLGAVASAAWTMADDDVLISLEWRPVSQTVRVGDPAEIGLYAVTDEETQLFRALDLVFAWDPEVLELDGLTDTGQLLSSGFPASGDGGLNEVVPPQDGDGYYRALAQLGDPIEVTPAGLLITTFEFRALATAASTLVEILPSGGSPLIETVVWGGPGANTNVTGTLGSAEVTVFCMECPGDLDGSGFVDIRDLAELLAHYGTTSGAVAEDGDLDCDGDVDVSDLAALLAVYHTSCD